MRYIRVRHFDFPFRHFIADASTPANIGTLTIAQKNRLPSSLTPANCSRRYFARVKRHVLIAPR